MAQAPSSAAPGASRLHFIVLSLLLVMQRATYRAASEHAIKKCRDFREHCFHFSSSDML
jgi:hypothetical protein